MQLAFYAYIVDHPDALVAQHWDLCLWPTAAFAAAVLLWVRYEFGWRRNVDMVVLCSAITAQTFHLTQRCACPVHGSVYVFVWLLGSMLYVVGWRWSHHSWELAIGLHTACHFTAYFCNIVLFRCVAVHQQSSHQ